MEKRIYDILIAGGGPAGYTAALYAARMGLSALLIEKLSAGGQMALTDKIDNYPGFPEGVDGIELGEKMRKGALRFGAEAESGTIVSAELTGDIKRLITKKEEYLGKTVVIATGAVPRKLGLQGEDKLLGRGLHTCAACDGMFYRGKSVAVIGGGNSALQDALLLSRICGKVTLIHRRSTFRADRIYQNELEHSENISVIYNTIVTDFITSQNLFGQDMLSGLRLKNVKTGNESDMEFDGVFSAIGRIPETGIFSDALNLTEGGYIRAGENTKTEIPGVFAAGDVREKALRQVVTAVSDGAVAAHFAEEYLREKKP